jgi:phytoene dehydrogenase-like protein
MTLPAQADAVVIGAGPNGLVAANVLADAGWDVVVLEAAPTPGGAVRTAELTVPGYRHDVFSAFYPLGAASPVLRSLHLEDHGLRWVRAPAVLAHPTVDGPTAVLSMDRVETRRSLERFAAGDGDRWDSLLEPWDRVGDSVVDALMRPFPPVTPVAALLARLGPTAAREFVRLALLSARRLGEEFFRGAGGRLLLTGLALHTDLAPDAAASGFFGWMLAGLGQSVGFPVPEGGAGELVASLVRRLEARGGQVVCDARVDRVHVGHGRATGVSSTQGDVRARRAVLADVSAPALYADLVGFERLPARVREGIMRFEHGAATVKVDWAVDGGVPWNDDDARRAGTVHIADSMEELTIYAAELANGHLPARPFLLTGQMTTTDPTRSPPGTESFWAYTHVPQVVVGDAAGELDPRWDDKTRERFADRMEQRIEDHAPGFRNRIVARHVLSPPDFARWDANLVNGDVNGGTAQLHQQLIFRPIPGLARAETPVPGLYLASASAHPGGGVHGAPGANAARAALLHDRLARARAAVAGAPRAILARVAPQRAPR